MKYKKSLKLMAIGIGMMATGVEILFVMKYLENRDMDSLMHSTLTLFVFALLTYTTLAYGLWLWRGRQEQELELLREILEEEKVKAENTHEEKIAGGDGED